MVAGRPEGTHMAPLRELGTACGSCIAALLGGECFPWFMSQQLSYKATRWWILGWGESRDAPRCLLGSQLMEGTQRGTLWIPLFGWAVARVSETTQACGAHPGGAFLAWLRTGSGVLP